MKGGTGTEGHSRKRPHENVEAETRVRPPQPKNTQRSQWPPEARRVKEISSLGDFAESVALLVPRFQILACMTVKE